MDSRELYTIIVAAVGFFYIVVAGRLLRRAGITGYWSELFALTPGLLVVFAVYAYFGLGWSPVSVVLALLAALVIIISVAVGVRGLAAIINSMRSSSR